VIAQVKGKTVFTAEFGPAVSKDPFLNFKFKGAAKGDEIVVDWVDNSGDKRSDKAKIT
jgi:sulfur-oxidizing protein SoxZ